MHVTVLFVAFWKLLIEAWSAAEVLAPAGTKHSLRDGPAVISPPEVEGVDGTVVVVVDVAVVAGALVGAAVVVVVVPVDPDPVEPDPVAVMAAVVPRTGVVVDVVTLLTPPIVPTVPPDPVETVAGAMTGRPTFFPSSVASSWFETERQSNSTEWACALASAWESRFGDAEASIAIIVTSMQAETASAASLGAR
jgi:hypothetical protein